VTGLGLGLWCALAGASSLLGKSVDAAPPSAIPYRWNNVTVGGGGFSPNIVFSPVEKGLAYLRTDIGGLYRYDRRVQRWVPLQDSMSEGNYFGVESVAPDPREANVVYAAVGMYRSGPAAIMRSNDRGATWQVVPVPFRMGGNQDGRGLGERLAVDPQDTNILYFGSRWNGLQRSTDAGRTWLPVSTFPLAAAGTADTNREGAGVSFVVFGGPSRNQVPTEVIFAGVADRGRHHLFRSSDAGASWQPVANEPSPDLLPVRAQFGSGNLFITYSNGIGPNGITAGAVFKLDAAGNTWQDITPPAATGPHAETGGGYMGLALDSRQPGTLMVATIDWWKSRDTLWRSTDAGRSWTSLRSLAEIDASETPFLRWGDAEADFGWWIAGLAIDPFDSDHVAYTTGATVYATDRVVPTSASRRTVWRPWVAGIEETAVLALASPGQGPPLLSGFGDIGGFVHENLDSSPLSMFVNPIFDNTDCLDTAGLAPNVVVRAGRPRQADAAAAWSQDFGKTWTPLEPPDMASPESGAAPGAAHRSTLVGANHTAPTVMAVSAEGSTFLAIHRTAALTRDRGRTWTAVRGLPDFAQVLADRVDARRFYALDPEHAQILGSDDGGASFVALGSQGLPHAMAADRASPALAKWLLLATPGRARDLWVASGDGLYHSTDGGHRFVRTAGRFTVTGLAFGKAGPSGYPSMFAIGARGGLSAIWRSDDAAASWSRINDAEHEYGRRFRVIAADPRIFGRVYVGTDGRGLLYGEPTP